MEKYLLSVDWLQFYCLRCSELADRTARIGGRTYEFKVNGNETPMWKRMGHVYYDSMEVATVCWNPRSSAIDANAVSVKMHNRILYSDYWWTFSSDVIDLLGVVYKGITRIDVCYDCNFLAGHRSVPQFLQDFVSHPALTPGHIIRSGSRRMTINATRDKLGGSSISAIRWGSHSNDVGAYCYNKSLEMLEVKRKPWIEQRWMEAGLVNVMRGDDWDSLKDSEKKRLIDLGIVEQDYMECPVWRFELSIKGHGKDLLNMATGELFAISLPWLAGENAIENLFRYYAAKYFDFRVNGGCKLLREYQPMKIFETDAPTEVRPRYIVRGKDTGRTEKIVVNTIRKYRETYIDLGVATADALDLCLRFFALESARKNKKSELLKQLESVSAMRAHQFMQAKDMMYIDFVENASKVLAQPIDHPAATKAWFDSLVISVAHEIQREDAMADDPENMPIL